MSSNKDNHSVIKTKYTLGSVYHCDGPFDLVKLTVTRGSILFNNRIPNTADPRTNILSF